MAEVEFTVNTRQFIAAFNRAGLDAERAIDRELFGTASDVLDNIVDLSPVDTGFFRAGWRGPARGARFPSILEWVLTNPTPYAATIEFGGYKGVGPKTRREPAQVFPGGIRVGAGIFPTQKPHAPVRRSLSRTRDVLLVRLLNAVDRAFA
jgi:hypothetical protein